MGAKTCFIFYAKSGVADVLRSRPAIDRDATAALVSRVFPSHRFLPLRDSNLAEAYPRGREVFAACFPGLSFISAKEFAPDRPSTLNPKYIVQGGSDMVYLHAMHSVVDWFAYAVWKQGELVRSLSVSPDSGVIEDIGSRMAFEEPFWAGKYNPSEDDEEASYPLPFHPLELSEAALLELFGFQLEGAETKFDPFDVPVCAFERRRIWWSLW